MQMGGRNTVLLDAISWRIPLVSDIPTIIFGADVTHPETGEDSSPSIAAVSINITSFYLTCLMYDGGLYIKQTFNILSLTGCCFPRLA